MNNLSLPQKKRLDACFKKIIFFIALGFAYYLFVLITDVKIPCIIKLITGKYCPGCGITRMFMALAKGNIVLAAKYNIFLLVLLPVALVWGIYRLVVYVKHGITGFSKIENAVLFAVFALTVIFWIMRNTSTFDCLAP